MTIAARTPWVAITLVLIAAGAAAERTESGVRDPPSLVSAEPRALGVAGSRCRKPGGQALDFEWSKVAGALRYELVVFERGHRDRLRFHAVVLDPRPTYSWCHDDTSLSRYQWRVRGLDRQLLPGPWSAPGEMLVRRRLPPDGGASGRD